MADEVNTTQSAAAPAAGTPQAAPEAAPTQEQQNAFQRFMSSLFGGKEPAAPAEGTKTTPAPQQEPEGKTYTEADLQARLEAAKAEWAAQQQEQARLEKLPPEERAKAEADAQRKNWRVCGRSCCSATLRTPPSSSWKRTVSPQGLPTCLPTRTRRPWKRAWPMCRVFSKAAWRPLSRNGCGARPRRAWAGPLLRKTPSGIRSRRISEEG